MEVDSVESLQSGAGLNTTTNYHLPVPNKNEMMLIIDEKITKAIGKLRTEIINVESRLYANQLKTAANITAIFAEEMMELKAEIMPLMKFGKSYCHVIHGEGCYWLELHTKSDLIKLTDAKTICRERGGFLANVYNQEHYNKMLVKIRSEMPSNSEHVYVWIGMRFNPLTGDVLYRNGDVATYANWIAGEYPKLGTDFAKRVNIDIKVFVDPNTPGGGMGNYDGSGDVVTHGVFCQI
uniref:uncharacterized protein LOC120331639 n=1 Tax=Styela clava TaxID=7725 RepID=UPI001939EBAA|nr:uncharacterized protein LOC120331639 [Styela clava]